jgi:hypothetical protein
MLFLLGNTTMDLSGSLLSEHELFCNHHVLTHKLFVANYANCWKIKLGLLGLHLFSSSCGCALIATSAPVFFSNKMDRKPSFLKQLQK